MGTFLIQHPLVQFYLLLVGSMWAVFICEYWTNPQANSNGARTLPNKAGRAGASPTLGPGLKEARCVSEPQRTMENKANVKAHIAAHAQTAVEPRI
jgi:hypothetical protein